jgi:glycosyltransferase involved in cell wall biosynthesis
MNNPHKNIVSAIVPVFNEERTVAGVVKVLITNSLIDEVICVNDGSADNSVKILNKFENQIQFINLKKNQGKGYALAQGIKKAKGDIVVFIDADLVNLSDDHIQTLLYPVLEDKKKVVLGYPANREYLPNIFLKLTGERVYFKKDLIPHLSKMLKTRFGVEVFLNSLFDENQVKKVPLKGLKGLLKHEKRNSKNALTEYLNEAAEIAMEVGKKEVISPRDKLIIKKFTKAISADELKKMVGKIYNKSVKQFMQKYVLKYLGEDIFK